MSLNITPAIGKTAAHRPRPMLLLIAALCFVAPAPLWAANIDFDDTNPNDTITISVNDFEGGFLVNGVLIQQGLGNPASATVHEDAPLNFSGTWIDLGQAQPGDRLIYLVESPYDPLLPPPLVSDILRYTVDRGPTAGFATIQGTFLSDFENNLGTLPVGTDPAIVFLEDGSPVLFHEPFLTGVIRSDAEVPEPATLGLLASGLVGLAYAGWRRKRS